MTGQEWQPIETAPRDGTVILLTYADDVLVGAWDAGESRYPWKYLDAEWRRGKGLVPFMNGLASHAPTHWMPLPAPPAPKGD